MEPSVFKPDYIALGAGGIRGMYFLGALHQMKSEGRLTNVKGYSGVSVGAIISLLTISGYEPMQIVTLGSDTKLFTDFFNVKLGERMAEMKENVGLISNTIIRKKLEEAVINKIGYVPTLKQLYMITKIDLYIGTYNITHEDVEIISYHTHPDTSCVTAVLLSTNIPLLFYQLEYEGSVYTDGAFVCPLVISPFDTGNDNVLTISVDVDTNSVSDTSQSISLNEYIHRIIMSPVKRLKKIIIENSTDKCKHLCFLSSISDITGTTLDARDKAMMIISGLKGCSTFLTRLDRGRGILDKVNYFKDVIINI